MFFLGVFAVIIGTVVAKCGPPCICEDNNIVYCRKEKLLSIPVQFIPSEVEQLHLDYNKISSLEPLSNYPNLKRLVLSNNNIKNLTGHVFRTLNKLTYLNLDNNDIGYVDNETFVGLTMLDDLHLSNNNQNFQINFPVNVSLPFKTLKSLSITGNNLSNIILYGLDMLEKLDVRNNTIENIQGLSKMTKLKYLNLQHNKFQIVPKDILMYSSNLQELDMSSNNIKHIAETFSDHLQNVEKLFLENNIINNIDPKSFYKLTNLKELNLANNRLSTLPTNIFTNQNNLENLCLNDNKFSELPANIFTNNSKLDVLNLNGNNLTNLTASKLQGLITLTKLYVDGNNLKQISFQQLPKLEMLSMKSNNIEDISVEFFQDAKHLRQLNMANNKLTTIHGGSFLHATNLIELNLNNNSIVNINPLSFNGLSSLQNLKLLNNELISIGTELNILIRLQHLDLCYNRIKDIGKTALNTSYSLLTVLLAGNEINTLPFGFLWHNRKLITLDLTSNTLLKCDCNLTVFLNSLASHSSMKGNCAQNNLQKSLTSFVKVGNDKFKLKCDLCPLKPCQNSGSCFYNSTSYNTICHCKEAFVGVSCDKVSAYCYKTQSCGTCKPTTCKNNGSCTEVSQKEVSCECGKSFSGTHCESIATPCNIRTHPCQQHGGCTVNKDNVTFTCHCDVEYKGKWCEINVCKSNKCQHRSTCMPMLRKTNDTNTYLCRCAHGYEGKYCENLTDPCLRQPCKNNATCVDKNKTEFECNCTESFTGMLCDKSKGDEHKVDHEDKHRAKRSHASTVGIVVGVILCLVFLTVMVVYFYKKKKTQFSTFDHHRLEEL